MKAYTYIVVEDEDLLRANIMKKMSGLSLPLTFAGEAYDGKEAMLLVEEHSPDIVITDIQMPAMDGLELSEELYFAYPRIKKIIISGHNDFDYARKALRFGVEDFLLKPVSVEELRQALQRTIVKLDAECQESADLKRSISPDLADPEKIVDMVEMYIRENFRQTITLGEVAESMGFTADYLSKLFKKHRSESPIRFLSRLRINEAKYLLANHPEYDIGTAGKLAGYSNPHYFSRVFKQQTGEYPSEFRNKKE